MKTDKRLFAGIIAVLALLHSVEPGRTAPRAPQPPWPEESIKIFGFDSGYARGPWRNLALNEDNATLLESWSGYALSREASRESFLPSPVIIPARVSETESNFAPAAGAIRCWFAANWSTASKASGGQGPGHAARLLELVDLNGKKAKTRWSLFFNAAGDTLFLAGETKLGAAVVLQAPVEFVAGDWRLISLCYSETNVVLQLDTATIAQAGGLAAPAAWEEKDLGLVIGSDVYASADSLAEGQFDEVVTKRRWPTKMDWQEMYFNSGKRRSWLGVQGTKEEEQAKVVALKSIGLLPDEYGMASQSLLEGGGTMAYSYAEGSLWLGILSVTNGQANLIVHGTEPEAAYEILSKETLTNSTWAGELPIVLGAAGQDWTAATVAIGARTNSLFLWARVLRDTDGDGLPDWWELEHGLDPNNPDTGNTGVPDGYKDSDNDGWTNLQEYQNGTSPGQFNTPAAPSGFAVHLATTGTDALFLWSPAVGPATSFTIERDYPNDTLTVANVASALWGLAEELPEVLYEGEIPQYRIQAHYSGGSSAWSEWRRIEELAAPKSAIRTASGDVTLLLLRDIPPHVAGIQVGLAAFDWSGSLFDATIALDQFTNGVAIIPDSVVQTLATNSGFRYVRFVLTNGVASAVDYSNNGYAIGRPFWDGRTQLKDNLRFLLRVATPENSFGGDLLHPLNSPTEYAYSSFQYAYTSASGTPQASIDALLPFKNNYLYRNFICDASDLSEYGTMQTGVFWRIGYGAELTPPGQFEFQAPAVAGPIASVLTANETRWTVWADHGPYPEFMGNYNLGVIVDDNDYAMVSGARNLFGLPYLTFLMTWGGDVTERFVLSPGNNLYDIVASRFYPETAQPVFQAANYYFARQYVSWYSHLGAPQLPGHAEFSPTNTSPLLIVSTGDPDFRVAGYVKLAVVNGYPGVYGFLGQYFDKAFTTTNGVVTTNETGILSPYGEFFPTEPGRTALVTLPDLETGERGTATVYVVSMNLDANHDGMMDRTFFGPDQTTAAKPFRFWVNNDNDAADYSTGYEINVLGVPDSRDEEIKSKRDLEDFARLWISGMPPLPSGQGYTVTLSSSGPGVQLFPAFETEGGSSYLTDPTTAANQITSSSRLALGRIAPGTNYVFPDGYFAAYGRKHFLFESFAAGTGELTLTITQGTNVLMQTSVYMDLRDVKNFYERAVITNSFTGAISNWTTGIYVVEQPQVTFFDESQDTFIYLHGGNNTEAEWLMRSDTLFKRLYWSGYRGKFATVRWSSPKVVLSSGWFNYSELIGYKSGYALKNYVDQLHVRFPTDRLHFFAQSLGGAISSEALSLGATVDTYILSQVSMSAGSYDVNAPTDAALVAADSGLDITPLWQPLGYLGGYTNLAGQAERVVNYHNPNDQFLDLWHYQQEGNKPNLGYSYDGTNVWRSSVFPVADSQESRALVARSRTLAIGSLGFTNQGVITSSLNLNAQFGILDSPEEHSAFFTRPIQSIHPYYLQILDSIAP